MSDLIASELLERGGGVEGGARVAGEGEVLVESVGGGVEDWNRVGCSVGEGLGVGCWESKPESPDDLLICSYRKYSNVRYNILRYTGYMYPNLLKIRPWAMDFSSSSKRAVYR